MAKAKTKVAAKKRKRYQVGDNWSDHITVHASITSAVVAAYKRVRRAPHGVFTPCTQVHRGFKWLATITGA